MGKGLFDKNKEDDRYFGKGLFDKNKEDNRYFNQHEHATLMEGRIPGSWMVS